MFPHRIPPDVMRQVFGRIGVAENMIVVAHLPKPLASALPERKSRARFENAHEFGEVRRATRALHQQVQMIGHKAVGMGGKIVSPRTVKQRVAHHLRSRRGRQIGPAQIATNGDEVRFGAKVILRGQAGLFSRKWHSYYLILTIGKYCVSVNACVVARLQTGHRAGQANARSEAPTGRSKVRPLHEGRRDRLAERIRGKGGVHGSGVGEECGDVGRGQDQICAGPVALEVFAAYAAFELGEVVLGAHAVLFSLGGFPHAAGTNRVVRRQVPCGRLGPIRETILPPYLPRPQIQNVSSLGWSPSIPRSWWP
jgi:hypothetical protein